MTANPIQMATNIATLTDVAARPYPLGATKWTVTATSVANTEASATIAAVADKKHYCLGYLAVIRGASAGSDVLITTKDDTTVKITDAFGNGCAQGTRIGIVSSIPILEGTVNKAMSLNSAAGGANAIIELTMWGYTI